MKSRTKNLIIVAVIVTGIIVFLKPISHYLTSCTCHCSYQNVDGSGSKGFRFTTRGFCGGGNCPSTHADGGTNYVRESGQRSDCNLNWDPTWNPQKLIIAPFDIEENGESEDSSGQLENTK